LGYPVLLTLSDWFIKQKKVFTKELHGEYVWDITQGNGERLVLANHEADLYKLGNNQKTCLYDS
jgi:hypothetical protein